MSDPKPKAFLTLELRCGCGAGMFVEVPQDAGYSLANDLTKLAATWTNAHARCTVPSLEVRP